MTKSELAQLIDAYADSKASGNKYLVQKMIEELEMALTAVCGPAEDIPPHQIPQPPAPPYPPFVPSRDPMDIPLEPQPVGDVY